MVNTAMRNKEIWEKVQEQISAMLGDKVLYESIFSSLKLHSLEKDEAVLITDSVLAQTLLSNDYKNLLKDALAAVVETEYKIVIRTEKDLNKADSNSDKKGSQKNFFSYSQLQPKFTFDNYVRGTSNLEAYQAATYVSRNMASYNPLFIYSKSGLGKTHLLNAIGNAVKDKSPLKKVLYITADDFVEEFVKYVKGDQDGENLKDYFRTIDYLLIDDIQFMASKPQTCTMFFHIFNILYNSGKQIVLTSDRAPDELEGLEDRLVSRFSSGMSICIDPPEKNTLLEILKFKIKANGTDVSIFDDDVLDYIVTNNSKNIRELEGALNRILFYNVTMGNCGQITMDVCLSAFKVEDKKMKTKGVLTPEKIISTVSSFYNIPQKEMTSKVRTGQIALARHIAMYLCRSLLDLPFAQISLAFQKKDHTTVMSACQKVEKMLKTDSNTKKAIKDLENRLKAA